MDAKLSCCALLLLFVCAALPTHGWTDEDERVFTEYDVDLGHYSHGLLAAETSILQARTAILTLETNFTVKYLAENITDLFTTLGTPAEEVDALQLLMQDRGLAINDAAQRVIDESQSLIDLANYINERLENYTANQLILSKSALKNEKEMLDTVVDLCRDNVELSLLLVNAKIDNLIGAQSGPEVDQINACVIEAETLMLAEQNKINAQKILVDAAYVQADAVLQALIPLAPPSF